MADPRDSRAYKTLARRVIREEPVCALGLAGCTRWSDTADHIVPVALRPDLALVRSNLQGACRHCNSSKQHRAVTADPSDLAPALDWFS